MLTWRKGRRVLRSRLGEICIPLDAFVSDLKSQNIRRVPGTAVYMSGNRGTPLALLHNLKHNKVLHEEVVLLTVRTEEVPYLTNPRDRVALENLREGFWRAQIHFGFMGRIGSELSRRAISFGMRVVAFDPYLSVTRARSLQVELVDELDDLLTGADFISLHTPFTAETHHILDAARLKKTKRGVRIINCARGGLVDEAALAQALVDGQVAGAALDVFEVEPLPGDSPLRGAPNVVLTPHLGASTAEAQESVGIEIAQSIRAVLLEGTIRNAVNMVNDQNASTGGGTGRCST